VARVTPAEALVANVGLPGTPGPGSRWANAMGCCCPAPLHIPLEAPSRLAELRAGRKGHSAASCRLAYRVGQAVRHVARRTA
jgi:hypothetical protein